ncbi:DUF3907 family protein, partial [Bacillus altitudinis]|uniref:DUF3907 family protein n=1 Tax=Bacillus altitudinis TaxID=293387 RepID=UPI0011A3B3DD
QLHQPPLFLSNLALEINDFLNQPTLSTFKPLNPQAEAYYSHILTTFPNLPVYTHHPPPLSTKIPHHHTFPHQPPHHTLHPIYHQSIQQFFTPKNHTCYQDT